MLTVCKHLIFDAPLIGAYDRVCLKGLGWSRSLLRLQSKSCLRIILVFMRWEDNYFTREAEIIIDIVYD